MTRRFHIGLSLVSFLVVAGCSATTSVSTSGAIPFPAKYVAELPGDRELWASLTPEQQQRALAFLSTGSTIQSSLFED